MTTDPALCIADDDQPDLLGTCAYDPSDNKIRFTPFARLSPADYERVHDAGFIWAGKQKLFVAPAWSPDREDLMLEWCGEIGDEDTTLVDRAEERADRFDGYRERRADEAESAREAVAAIADNIPLGQPLLLGHHSYAHALRDKKKIEGGMRKAVNLWRTSQYWEQRAAGALAHASYKEVPAVRHRRIKGLEADLRKYQDASEASATNLRLWGRDGLTREQAMAVANHSHISMRFPLATYPREPPISQYEGEKSIWSALDDNIITAEQAQLIAVGACERSIARRARWIQHLGFRIAYERAMLDESGGIAADRFDVKPGGKVLVRSSWYVVKRVNREGGRINSVSTFGAGVRGIEEVNDYREPAEGDAEKVKAATKILPLANYPGEGFRHMLKAEWDRCVRSQSGAIRKVQASEQHGAHRQREGMKPNYGGLVNVYVTDEKIKQPPPPSAAPEATPTFQRERVAPCSPAPAPRPAVDDGAAFRALEDSLRAGVQVAVVPQLFVTPGPLAVDVVERADVEGHTVLEPSAGLGALALECLRQGAAQVVCIDNAEACCQALQALAVQQPALRVLQRDFLTQTCRDHERYLRVIMNPPFSHGADVQHVTHAFRHWLAPGGLLVAIMSAGTASRDDKATKAFRALVEAHGSMEELPDGSFEASGTSVRTVLVTLRAPAAAEQGKPGQLELITREEG